MNINWRHYIVCGLLAVGGLTASAQELRLPRFFESGMVLQRDAKIPVWGWAKAGSTVTVSLAARGGTGSPTVAKAVADADGEWKVYMPKLKANGEGVTMTVSADGKTIEMKDILVGDVFLCSGQSNMELPIRRCMDVVRDDVVSYSNSQIRYLKFPHQYNYVSTNKDVHTLSWQQITPETCGEVSGICYFMARYLQENQGVPVGIINSAVGGTQVQAWMPNEVLRAFKGYEEELSKQKYHQINWPDSVNRAEQAAGRKWDAEMMAQDVIVNKWRQADYSFDDWKTVNIFSNWSEGKNGSFWFHCNVNLDASKAGAAATLRVGAMKDADSVFVNGTFVGNTTYEYPPRIYKVPAGVLREGNNDIVIHLMSQSGRANFTSGKLYQLEVGEDIVPLGEEFKMAVGSTMPRRPSSTYFVDTPTGLYNAMIAPLKDFPIKAMMWYQGESNQGQPDTYAPMLEAMVESWRKQFGRQFPVAIVQLAGYMSRHEKPHESGWTKIRNQQYHAALNIKNAGLVSIFDTGEWNDIHPQDKRTAGYRASLIMRKLAYGDKKTVCEAPMPLKAKKVGDDVVVTFSQPVCVGKDAKSSSKTVTIPAADLNTVTYNIKNGMLRYAWDDYPICTLFGTTGIPVPQFEMEIK